MQTSTKPEIATGVRNLSFVRFNYGKVMTFEDMPYNSIALDGAVQGPKVDAAMRRFSFDHHADCIRMITLATCQQVWTALKLGLVVEPGTLIFINDLDADTVLATWLLLEVPKDPEILNSGHIRELVDDVGRTDAHGPIFPARPIHIELGPRWGDKTPQSEAMLEKFLQRLDKFRQDYQDGPTPDTRSGRGYGLKATGTWEPVRTYDGFGPLYEQGYFAAALVTEANEGTSQWVIGKRSDLVPLPLGPADASKDRSGDYTQTILGELAKAEAAKGVKPQDNWGGATSIGGSPRLPGGKGSSLSEEEVLSILNQFVINK